MDWRPGTLKRCGTPKMRLKNLILILGIVMFPLHTMCVDLITNLSGQPDATSVILTWTPYSDPQSIDKYTVSRNNQVAGSTICKLGYFSDFGLQPGNNYQYRVQGLNANGHLICESGSLNIQTTTATEIKTDYTLLAIVFDPTGEVQEHMPRIENFLKYRIDFLRYATHNSVNLSLYESQIITLQSFPPVLPENNKEIAYDKLAATVYPELSNQTMVNLIESYKVDVVWLIGAPELYDFAENALVGNHNLGNNEWISNKKVLCSRSFFIHHNGAEARAFDAAAHHIEGTMTSASSKDPIAWPRDKEYIVFTRERLNTTTYTENLHLFEVFRLTDEWTGLGAYASKGNANCGSSHFVPGSIRNSQKYDDYTYYDIEAWKRYVPCFADNWLNYPEFSNEPRILNGYDHGAFNHYALGESQYSFRFGEASYHYWWLNHIPNKPGTYFGMLNNWWPYIFDLNRFTGAYVDYEVTGFPEIPAGYSIVNKEYGTESFNADDWSFWHSTSWRGQRADISIAQKSSHAENVLNGNQSIKVDITMHIPKLHHKTGRNDLIYPRYKNAHWSFSENHIITLSIKPESTEAITGTNPIIRLCTNGNNRIEYVPANNGLYIHRQTRKSPVQYTTGRTRYSGLIQWFTRCSCRCRQL